MTRVNWYDNLEWLYHFDDDSAVSFPTTSFLSTHFRSSSIFFRAQKTKQRKRRKRTISRKPSKIHWCTSKANRSIKDHQSERPSNNIENECFTSDYPNLRPYPFSQSLLALMTRKVRKDCYALPRKIDLEDAEWFCGAKIGELQGSKIGQKRSTKRVIKAERSIGAGLPPRSRTVN